MILYNPSEFFLFFLLLLQIKETFEMIKKGKIYENLEVIEKELEYSNQMKKKFNPLLYKYLKHLNILKKDYSNVTIEERRNPVFVTSVSDHFIPRAIVMLKSVIKHFPRSKIIVYDLGLIKENVRYLKKICNVIYKKFIFNKYPSHVSNLITYAFKPLVIAEVIRNYKAIWYLDSSLTITRSNLTDVYTAMESKKSPYILHNNAHHGIIRATFNKMFDYLPSNTKNLLERKVSMYEAGFVYVVRNNESMKKIMKWYVLCALQKDCIAPEKSKKKCRHGIFKNSYGKNNDNCHRQDQSIINILLWNAYNETINEYTSGYNNFYKIERHQKGKWGSLPFCR